MMASRKHRTVLWGLVSAGAGCLVLVFGAVLFIRSDLGQDVLYDNVPSHAGCEEVPAQSVVEDAVADFPIFDDSYASATSRCSGAIIEVQYGNHDTRQKLETYLNRHGENDPTSGWWWRSIPVELRNV